jgi:metallo-beta-lactamase family protein
MRRRKVDPSPGRLATSTFPPCASATVDQAKSINHIKDTAIIIAGSGMCAGGRVKHHLQNNLDRPESTILFVGYQAFGTLGRRILEKPETVRILGEEQPVRARIERISGFSAHADKNELYRRISAQNTAAQGICHPRRGICSYCFR